MAPLPPSKLLAISDAEFDGRSHKIHQNSFQILQLGNFFDTFNRRCQTKLLKMSEIFLNLADLLLNDLNLEKTLACKI